MFGCNNPQTAVNPSGPQQQINENQLKFMKGKCEGKESCTAEACNSWWNTNLNCPSHEPAIMWLHYHCNGVPGGGKLDTKLSDFLILRPLLCLNGLYKYTCLVDTLLSGYILDGQIEGSLDSNIRTTINRVHSLFWR